VRGDLAVLVDFSFELGGQRATYTAQATANLHDEVGRQVFDQTCSIEENQLPMFVGNVHALDDCEGVKRRIDSLVRLELLDEIECTSVHHTLYLSVVSGQFVFRRWPLFKDGKFYKSGLLGKSTGFVGTFPNDVIQAGPEMVNDFSCKDAKAKRDGQRLVILDSLRESLILELWENRVLAFTKEPRDLRIEILDVLVGPF
jgi:hypothetical protein